MKLKLELPLQAKKPLFIFISVSLCFLGVYVVKSVYLFSPMLLADDRIYLTNFTYFNSGPSGLHFLYLNHAVSYLDVEGVRIFTVFIVSASLGGVAYCFWRIGGNSRILILMPALVLLFPVSAPQFVFVNGSHAMIAFPMLVVAFIATLSLVIRPFNTISVILATVALISFYIANELTNVASFASLAVLSFGFFGSFNKNFWKLFLIFSIGFIPTLYWVYSYVYDVSSRNHYDILQGWVNTDPLFAIHQYLNLLELGFLQPSTKQAILYLVLFLMVTIFIEVTFIKKFEDSSSKKGVRISSISGIYWQSVMYWVVIGVLFLVPPSVVTHLTTRYVELPVAAFLIALFGILAGLIINRHVSRTVFAGFALTTISWGWIGNEFYKKDLEHHHVLAIKLQQGLSRYKDDWPKESQVLIVGDNLSSEPSFNHWSSGYLRHLTGRSDIIGLIGSPNQMAQNPLVDIYRDHGSEYWAVNAQGRSYRKKMMGLEKNRPTYAYRLNGDGELNDLKGVLVMSGNQVKYVALSGQGFAHSDEVNGVYTFDFCNPDIKRNSYAIFQEQLGDSEFPVVVNRNSIGQKTFSFNGIESKRIQIADDITSVYGEFLIKPKLDHVMDSSQSELGIDYPPTPVLWPGHFQLWQISTDNIRLVAPGTPGRGMVSLETAVRDGVINFRFYVIPGCVSYFELNGEVASYYGSGPLGGFIQIGHGHLQRGWVGEIETIISIEDSGTRSSTSLSAPTSSRSTFESVSSP